MLPEGWYYWFQSTGQKPLALLRFSARKGNPKVLRVDVKGRTREKDEEGYRNVDGAPVDGQYWDMS